MSILLSCQKNYLGASCYPVKKATVFRDFLLQSAKICYNVCFLGDNYVSKIENYEDGQAKSAVL